MRSAKSLIQDRGGGGGRERGEKGGRLGGTESGKVRGARREREGEATSGLFAISTEAGAE